MPLTPAKQHFIKATASQAGIAVDFARYADTAQANQYEIMLMQLADHKRRLKEIKSLEKKAEVKKEILAEYAPYIAGVLDSDAGAQDDVLMTILVWSIDAGSVSDALVLADYALRHGLVTPEQYKRDPATLVAEEIADLAMRDQSSVTIDELVRAEELTREHDMPDEVRAKIHKSLGVAYSETDKTAAVKHLRRALQLNERAGVKKMIEKLERELQQKPN